MFLKSIKLHNIRSYRSEEIIFSDGKVLLSGDIGAGKSTILLALEFALFGIRRGDLSGVMLLRHGEREGSVELRMVLSKKNVVIKRRLKRMKGAIKQDPGELTIEGSQFTGTPIELKAKILDLLGYPKNLLSKSKDLIFRFTVYTPQEEMKRIISEDTETRLDTLRKIFNIDKYKKVKENALLLERDIKSRITLMEGKISDLDELKQNLDEKKKAKEGVIQTIKELNENISGQKKQLLLITEEIARQEKLSESINQTKKELAVQEAGIRSFSEQQEAVKKNLGVLDQGLEALKRQNEELVVEKPTEKSVEEIQKETERYQKLINDSLNSRKLVEQIKNKGISDENVLSAIEKVPRHFFMDSSFLEFAYDDKPFPIGAGQTISQPYTVAYQTELLNIRKGDKVLEVGTGSGYQSCILLEMGAKVYTIERIKSLYQKTKTFLPQIGYFPKFFFGDGYKGLPAFAPFDRIIVTAGAPVIPDELLIQLSIGGIMVIPVGANNIQIMTVITKKSDNSLEKKEMGYFRFVPLLEDKEFKKNEK